MKTAFTGKTKRLHAALQRGGILLLVREKYTCYGPIDAAFTLKPEEVQPLFEAFMLVTMSYGLVGWIWVLAPAATVPATNSDLLERVLTLIQTRIEHFTAASQELVTAKPTDPAGEGSEPNALPQADAGAETVASTKDRDPSSPSADKGDV